MARKAKRSSARKKSSARKRPSRSATGRASARKRGTSRAGTKASSRKRGTKRPAARKGAAKRGRTAKRKQSPVARVKRVTRGVVQQAAGAVSTGMDTLRDFGGNLVDRVRSGGTGGSGESGG